MYHDYGCASHLILFQNLVVCLSGVAAIEVEAMGKADMAALIISALRPELG